MPAFLLLLPQEAYLFLLLSRLRRGAEHDLNLTRSRLWAVTTVRSILLQTKQQSPVSKRQCIVKPAQGMAVSGLQCIDG